MNPVSAADGSVTVRRMCVADIEEVMAIAASLNDAPHWSPAAYLASIQPDSTPRRIALVAVNEPEAQILGFAVANVLPPQAELESIAVRRDAQRQGIGSRLMDYLNRELKVADVSELLLEVRASNLEGIAFYHSLGLRKTGLRPRYYTDPEEDAILMSQSQG